MYSKSQCTPSFEQRRSKEWTPSAASLEKITSKVLSVCSFRRVSVSTSIIITGIDWHLTNATQAWIGFPVSVRVAVKLPPVGHGKRIAEIFSKLKFSQSPNR